MKHAVCHDGVSIQSISLDRNDAHGAPLARCKQVHIRSFKPFRDANSW